MPSFVGRKTRKMGPLRFTRSVSGDNVADVARSFFKGYRFSGVKLWRYSWSRSTGKSTFNTPGFGAIRWGGKSRRRTAR